MRRERWGGKERDKRQNGTEMGERKQTKMCGKERCGVVTKGRHAR